VSRWVLHVDLDQFLAAVEVLRRPELRGRPVVVGGDGDPTKRGVVSTASHEARACGVRSGLPMRTAARRCPDAVFLPVDKPVYEAVSAEVMATLREVDGVLEVVGWDEAFLGVETDDPDAVARRIQQRVRSATRLDCSVGIGQNKLQAKLATSFGKPAGIGHHATWTAVMADRPTDALWGPQVAEDVAQEARDVVRVVVKVRWAPFTTQTHGTALVEPTRDPQVLETAALAALEDFTRRRPVGLLGVRAEFAGPRGRR
jgi:nucleotidyltransferase/DNA polymerase involved in DNA repair